MGNTSLFTIYKSSQDISRRTSVLTIIKYSRCYRAIILVVIIIIKDTIKISIPIRIIFR